MSDERNTRQPASGELSRRDLLVKAGVVGAGAIAAGVARRRGEGRDQARSRDADQAGRPDHLGPRVGSRCTWRRSAGS